MYIVMVYENGHWVQAHKSGTLYVRDFMTCLNVVSDYTAIGALAYMEKWDSRNANYRNLITLKQAVYYKSQADKLRNAREQKQ